jgi:hypothetical protein
MSVVTLPERWILHRHMRMLRRVLHAARAHARHSYPFVVDRLTEGITLVPPDPQLADATAIQTYLSAVGQTVLETRCACNDLFDRSDTPYKLIQSDEPGGATLISPGCESAMSLLDAVDDNVTNMLVCWGQNFWCRPRVLYDRIRRHEIKHESGLARFTGFLDPVDILAPSKWECDT